MAVEKPRLAVFRHSFRKNEDDQGDHQGRNGGTKAFVTGKQVDKQEGTNRCDQGIDHVVAYEDGNERIVVVVENLVGAAGALVACFSELADSELVAVGKCGFSGRKKRTEE